MNKELIPYIVLALFSLLGLSLTGYGLYHADAGDFIGFLVFEVVAGVTVWLYWRREF